jgi:hypothetical protein
VRPRFYHIAMQDFKHCPVCACRVRELYPRVLGVPCSLPIIVVSSRGDRDIFRGKENGVQ